MSDSYSISELAREFGVTTRTIRFYEEQGLIQPTREGQKRLYTGADRVRLELILRGKRLGFTLAESRQIIDMYDPVDNHKQMEALLVTIDAHRQKLLAQRAELDAMLAELDDAEQRARGSVS